MVRYYYTVTTVADGEPSYHKFYCSQTCTERRARHYFEKKGYCIDSISGIWKD